MNFQEFKVDIRKYVCPESCTCFGYAVRCTPLTLTEIPQDMLPGMLITSLEFWTSWFLSATNLSFILIYKNDQSGIKHLTTVFKIF